MSAPASPLPTTLAECQALIAELRQKDSQQQATISLQRVRLLELTEANSQQQAKLLELTEINVHQQATIAQQQATLVQQQATIDDQQSVLQNLQRDLALLKRTLFGQRRERYEDPRQGTLFDAITLDELSPALAAASTLEPPLCEEPDEPAESRSSRRGRVRRVIPETLPRIQRVQELTDEEIPEELRGAEHVRRFRKKVGEYLEWEPPRLMVVEEYVETLAVDNVDATQSTLYSAARPPRIFSGLAGPGLLAGLATHHFADHLPYYRLEEDLCRSGVEIDRGTLCRWMIRLGEELSPLTDLMRRLTLESAVVQADETPIKMLVPGRGKTATTYLWAVLGDPRHPYTTFSFTTSRSRAGPAGFFAEFGGVLVSDAYIGYELLEASSEGRIQLAGCYSHARRKFEELHALAPTERTATALGYFQRLFDLEDLWRDLSDEARHQRRQAQARPLLEEFKHWLDEQLATLRPKHELRGAIQYMTTRWECFERFLQSGAIPIHNNASEQAVKNAVIGKKNWLFFGSEAGGAAAAVLYTLTATCRRLRIEPFAYLKDVCERLPSLLRFDREPGDLARRADGVISESPGGIIVAECADGVAELPGGVAACPSGVPDHLSPLLPLLPDRWLAEHPAAELPMRRQESQTKAATRRRQRSQRRQALARANRNRS